MLDLNYVFKTITSYLYNIIDKKMKEHNNIYLLFEKAARLYPDDCCLSFQNTSLTYKQLENKVSEVYLTLIKYAKNENIIGLSTTRGIDQVIFMLAILKAGKAYLPIDFGYPKSRIQNIIKNSNLTFCLSNKADEDIVVSMGLKLLKNNNLHTSTDSKQDSMSQNAAYILYTSGSTGEPKGVCMGQGAVINLIDWQNKNSTSKKGTRTLQFAPLSFDVSFQEIMATLSTGGTLVLIEEYLRLDMVALINFIKNQEVNRLFLPFVALQALAEAALSTGEFPQTLKEIMTAGEQLKITPQISTFFTKLSDCILYNQYGPTECHVVTELKLDGDPANWPTLPSIGKPISNTSILILNQKQEILEIGEIGELYISGECLAEGYLNNKQLTNEKFLDWKSPEGKNIRVYRSGDIAKYLADGNIEFLGRQDDQVKISGHRIELAEVELAINSLNGILQTVVISSNHLAGQTQLVAYLQTNQEQTDVADIRKKVSNLLPDYMVPSYFIFVKDFSKTSSGKIDKKALPIPEYSRPSSAPLYKKATTEIQKNITKAWVDTLNIPEIGIDDNFFELGGTSLLAQKVVSILLKDYNYKLPVTKLYRFPKISEICDYLETDNNIETKKTILTQPVSDTVETPLPPTYNAVLETNNLNNSDLGLIVQQIPLSRSLEQSDLVDLQKLKTINTAPVLGAKLGRDQDGNPAWFVEDSNIKGQYVQINLSMDSLN
jgi:amino acid adenylation domain-containing protein